MVEIDVVIALLRRQHQIAEPGFLARDHAAAGFIPCRAIGDAKIVGKQGLKPCGIDGGGAAEMDDDLARLHLGDFCRDEGRGVFDAGFLVEFSPAIADEFAGKRALIEADGELVAETGKHRMADGFAAFLEIHRPPIPAETGRQRAKPVKPLCRFAGSACENAELAAALRIEFHRFGGFEGAPFTGEIRVVVRENEILAAHAAAFIDEDPLALDGGGDERGFRDAAVFVAGEHEPGKPRLEWQQRHFRALLGERTLGIERAEVMQQLLRPRERSLGRGIKPAEIADFGNARGFQQQHRLRKIHTMDFRRLKLRAACLIRFAPQAERPPRRGAARTAGPLFGGGAGDFFDQQRIDRPARLIG